MRRCGRVTVGTRQKRRRGTASVAAAPLPWPIAVISSFLCFILSYLFIFFFRFGSGSGPMDPPPPPTYPPTSGSWDSFNDASDGHRSTSGTGLEIHFRFVEFRSDAATAFRMDVQPALRFRLVGSFALLFVSVNQALTVCNGWADAPGDWNIISI